MIQREVIKLILYIIFAVLVFVTCFYGFYKRRVILSDFSSIFSMSSITGYYSDLKALNIERWSLVLILFLGAFLRLWNLADWVPIFVDEGAWGIWGRAIYYEFALDDFRWLFITYRFAGKPPLVAILYALSFHIFGINLFAIRVVSALSGILSILFVYKLGRTLFGQKVGLVSALIFSIIPYDVYYSRLALQDPVVSSLITGSILCYVYGFQRNNSFSILLGGVLFGLAINAKQLGLKVGIIILLYLLLTKQMRPNLKKIPFWISLILTAIVHYPFLYYAALRDFSLYLNYLTHEETNLQIATANTSLQIATANTSLQITTTEISSALISRMFTIPSILYIQLSRFLNMFTVPIFILALVGMGTLFLKKKTIEPLPVIWILVELFTSWIPHSPGAGYVLSIVPPASITAGIGLTLILKKTHEMISNNRIRTNIPPSAISLFIISICVSYTIFFSFTLILTPREARIHSDFKVITDSRWSGYGWKESIEYLQQENYSADTVIFPMPRWGFEFLAKDIYPRIFGVGYIRAYFEGSDFSKSLIEDNICVFLVRRFPDHNYEEFNALLETFSNIKLVEVIVVNGIPEVYIFVKS